ncbi:MAG: hypothetical protein HY698_07670 [Deltaproteobacteria bacterium]|nr:hypothetical protein [Deltaproteobacteria bacterium]
MIKTAITVLEPVNRFELAAIKRDRAKLVSLKAEVEALVDSLRRREEDVIARIDAGCPVDGDARVLVRRRQNISWLTIVKQELGEEAVVRAKDEWPVSFYKELQVG